MAFFQVEFCVKSLARRTKMDIVIPSLGLGESLSNKDENYYQNREKKFPLLIFLHGFGESEKAWTTSSNAIRLCEENGVAACFINGENKWYLNMGQIDDFYNLLEKEVTDFLYGNFKCLSKDMPLGIIGESMGGYGALYHYLKNRDKYYCGIALSPATRPDFIDESKYGTIRELALAAKGENNVYLSIGTKDFIIEESKKLDEFFIENEVGFRYRYVEGMPHSWELWSKELYNVFEYLKEIKFIK